LAILGSGLPRSIFKILAARLNRWLKLFKRPALTTSAFETFVKPGCVVVVNALMAGDFDVRKGGLGSDQMPAQKVGLAQGVKQAGEVGVQFGPANLEVHGGADIGLG
jgi:hypothetical protein